MVLLAGDNKTLSSIVSSERILREWRQGIMSDVVFSLYKTRLHNQLRRQHESLREHLFLLNNLINVNRIILLSFKTLQSMFQKQSHSCCQKTLNGNNNYRLAGTVLLL